MTGPNHDEETTARERDNARRARMTEMPKAATLETQDKMRAELSRIEDKVLEGFDQIQGSDARWLAIARTHVQIGFMAAKRALYEGKRVGDP